MAKISPVSIKYMIYASFKSAGPLEKPDVIGAIFGQTEGLLGEDLEMRELQKEGKIGRIEVELETVDGKSVGEIRVPSALDKSETTLVAAALETIDKIGPTEAKIEISKIEDVRGSKRDYIMERAKKLMEGIGSGDSFKEMSDSLKEDTRADRIQEYGDEKLPAGNISGSEVIVVEGRADVVNLLRNRVNNVIGMDGTKLPRAIAELGRTKELTLFIDGDRGGRLIAKNVISNADIKYVTSAPDGKEVEELTGKEILIALRRKVDVKEFLRRERITLDARPEVSETIREVEEIKQEFAGDAKAKIREIHGRLKEDRGVFLLDANLDVIRKASLKEAAKSIRMTRQKVFAVIVEGTAASSVISACDENGVRYLAATGFGNVGESKVEIISL
ncbi:DNA primase [Candidatus Pacearchaeota archaeon]|nr:DNA primase [Candidatus Pacearchaeota archaeon]